MKSHNRIVRKNEKGATAVYAAVILAALLGFAALGVDVNYLYGVRNELQNAADAGALAGASVLLEDDCDGLEPQASIDEATRAASANKTGNQSVVEITVETGHWSFTTRQFTANPAIEQPEWQERPFSELDIDTDYINAVRVQTDRSDTPSFFAKLLGFDRFFISTDAVAWRGFAGPLYQAEIDQPIAICKEVITNPDGSYTCDVGRMINSGSDPQGSHNTGGWTNFSQEECSEPRPNSQDLLPLICANGNPNELKYGVGMGVKGGEATPAMEKIRDCWKNATGKTTSWNITLPVVKCGNENNPHGCLELVGAVTVDVVWIYDKNSDGGHSGDYPLPKIMHDVPGYDNWEWSVDCELLPVGGKVRTKCEKDLWDDFADHFNLANPNLVDKSIYFLPNCDVHEPTGGSGGENYGVCARIPKLVE